MEQIHHFRNGHWMFVQKYIMANTKYNVATGGTPLTTWIPNQILAVLNYMRIILSKISNDDNEYYKAKKDEWEYKYNVLMAQIEELKKVNYNIDLVFECEGKLAEN